MNQNQLVLLVTFLICCEYVWLKWGLLIIVPRHSCWTFEPKRFETILYMREHPFRVRFQHIDGWDLMSPWMVRYDFARCLACWSRCLTRKKRPQLVVMFWKLYHHIPPIPIPESRKKEALMTAVFEWGFRCLESYTHFAMFFTHKTATTRTGLHPMHFFAMDLWILGSQEMMFTVVRFAGMGWLVMIAPQFYGIDAMTFSSI